MTNMKTVFTKNCTFQSGWGLLCIFLELNHSTTKSFPVLKEGAFSAAQKEPENHLYSRTHYQPNTGFLPCLAISTLSSQTAKPVVKSVIAI